MRKMAAYCVPFLMLAACGGGAQKKESPAPLVEAKPVGAAVFADTIDAVGTAMANEQVVLAAPVTERITSINFADGGYVARGQVIATLAQGEEQAQLAAAQARVVETRQQLDRMKSLRERGFVTSSAFDTQTAAQGEAEATAAQARATISDRIIRAPFAGWVSLRMVSPGAIVTSGTPIATVSDISRIKLDFTVPETRLSVLSEGQQIEAEAAAFPDRPFRGTIATIDPVIDPVTRAVRVRAILPNPDKALKPGMLLTVKVIARERQALALPELAVVGDGEERFVFLATEDGKVKRVPVKTGERQGGLVEIRSGLTPGQRVVTDGVVKLSDGMPIREAAAEARADGERGGGAPPVHKR